MIAENDWCYLDREDIRTIHAALSAWAEKQDEPVPPFTHANSHDLDALVNTPRQKLFGKDAYPTIAEKAAIIFYTVNKKQIFLNGNKRMSTLCLIVFLGVNNKELDVMSDDLTKKALWLANTESLEFPAIKSELTAWIAEHLRNKSSAPETGQPA